MNKQEELERLEQDVKDAEQVALEDEEAFKIAAHHMEMSKKHLVECWKALDAFKSS